MATREGKFMVRGADGKVQDLLMAVHGSEDTNLYQKILKQWNQCYRKGLLDPKSRTKDMDTYEADKKSGKVLCLIDGINRNSEYDTKWKETAQERYRCIRLSQNLLFWQHIPHRRQTVRRVGVWGLIGRPNI